MTKLICIYNMFATIAHFFFPGRSNNHKAKLIQSSTIFIITIAIVAYQALLISIPKTGVDVLGYAANISVGDVVSLTNQKRVENGVPELTINQLLNEAARRKGEDMLANNYWAHVSPNGTQPWKFFVDAGYTYRYAGENLARDFSNPSSAVEAWMASPSHRDNLLSTKYDEVGIGVVEGDLEGVDTTIIVQLFGARSIKDQIDIPVVSAATSDEVERVPTQMPVATPTPSMDDVVPPIASTDDTEVIGGSITNTEFRFSPFNTTRTISLVVLGILMVVMVIDSVVVTRKRIPRKSGRVLAHLAFLSMIFVIALIVQAGRVL